MYVSKKPRRKNNHTSDTCAQYDFFTFLLSLNLSAIISFLLSAVLSIYAHILILIILQRKMDFCNLRFLFISGNKLFYLLITRTLLIRCCIDFQEFIIFFVTVKISSVMTADIKAVKTLSFEQSVCLFICTSCHCI